MNKNHGIGCNVKSCKFQDQEQCHADTIQVVCDNCIKPKTDHETCCMTFIPKQV